MVVNHDDLLEMNIYDKDTSRITSHRRLGRRYNYPLYTFYDIIRYLADDDRRAIEVRRVFGCFEPIALIAGLRRTTRYLLQRETRISCASRRFVCLRPTAAASGRTKAIAPER
ncbi:hypothetical protein TCAP_00306 [Tolypocladium capitatum]|uniref:Uncharacterized protein n=1 Tax=Tolypocladium capitatum TaxID=45235 RepID=A0A2K3QQH8_9HYPO|nr:hypothetical protein TCAP_00306 [Tolypocladium capitatum]